MINKRQEQLLNLPQNSCALVCALDAMTNSSLIRSSHCWLNQTSMTLKTLKGRQIDKESYLNTYNELSKWTH